jgi:hypothetical protein
LKGEINVFVVMDGDFYLSVSVIDRRKNWSGYRRLEHYQLT